MVVAAPTELLHYFSSRFDAEGRTCKLAEYFRVLVAVASVLNLVAVTLERFVVIVMPLRSRSICTMTNCRRSLVVVWGLSMLLAVPVTFTKVHRIGWNAERLRGLLWSLLFFLVCISGPLRQQRHPGDPDLLQ